MGRWGKGEIAERQADPALHYCFFRLIRSSIHYFGDDRMVSHERCSCGRTKRIDCKFDLVELKSPKLLVSWFDKEGNLERVTGDN
jgi:hypothetical protein